MQMPRNSNDWPLIGSEWLHAGPFALLGGRMISPWALRARIEALGRTGFRGIGLYHDGLAHALDHEAEGTTRAQKLGWLKRLLDDNGLAIVELEFLTGWLYPAGHPRREEEHSTRELLLDAATALQARHIKVGNIDGVAFDLEHMRESFATLCDEAAQAGTRIAFELIPPDPHCQTLAQTLEWVGSHAAGGLFLDAWHMNNIPGISYADIAALPPGSIVGIELDDGLRFDEADQAEIDAAGMSFIERTSLRRIAGEGDYDIEGFIRAVFATGHDGPWGHEILNEEYRRLPMGVAYRRAYRAASRLLDRVLGAPLHAH